jgi:hypothetical protein
MATLLDIPTKGDLGITSESEVDYTRLVKFLRLHEPTGHERDVAHKYDVVRFLTLKQMLHECQQAKVTRQQPNTNSLRCYLGISFSPPVCCLPHSSRTFKSLV